MAIALTKKRVGGVTLYEGTLIDAATGVGNGEWVDVQGLDPFSIQATGITTATIAFYGSNAATIPADASHVSDLDGAITTNDVVTWSGVQMKWFKARVFAHTTGTITVRLNAQSGN